MEFPHKVEYNIHFLIAFPVYLFRRINNDFLDKLIDDCGREFRNPHILADNGGEAVKIVPLLNIQLKRGGLLHRTKEKTLTDYYCRRRPVLS